MISFKKKKNPAVIQQLAVAQNTQYYEEAGSRIRMGQTKDYFLQRVIKGGIGHQRM